MDYPGYYEIPGYSNYVLSKDGIVINRKKGTSLKGSKNPAGYVNFRLTDDTGYTLTFGRHRLLLYVFKPIENIGEMVTNHLNAIKGDDRLSNLEWTTITDNLKHAQKMGLMEFTKEVFVRNCRTGEVKHYLSYVDCAEALNLSKDAISYRVKTEGKKVFPELLQYRSNSDSDWYIPNPLELLRASTGNYRALYVKNIITEEIVFYPKLTDFCNESGISMAKASQILTSRKQEVLPGFIQIKEVEDETPWRAISDPYLELEKTTGNKCVVLYNEREGISKFFTSITECSKNINVAVNTIHYRLNSKIKREFEHGFKYFYYLDFKKL